MGFLLIWIQDTAWIQSATDTLPALAALPLFIWLGKPWDLNPIPRPPSARLLITALILLAAGLLTDLTLLLALGWTALLWGWLSPQLGDEAKYRGKRLLILPIMAFPWLLLDGHPVGWWFRLSGAQATQWFFNLFEINVLRRGTLLLVETLPVDVAPACSGLNTLQAMLIAGTVIAFLELGKGPMYWFCLPLLILTTWLANTLRIITITGTALRHGPDVADGIFHTIGGWVILMLMFLICTGLFRLMASGHTHSSP